MASHLHVEITATEMPHFRRLVEFVEQVEQLADERCDLELQDLVEAVRDDLLRA